MTRKAFCERIQREIYGSQPNDDAEITKQLINNYVNVGIAMAVKQNYTDNLKMDGIAYVNNSFYTTFRDLPIAKDTSDYNLWYITLPEIPVALGENEGISQLIFRKGTDYSLEAIPLNAHQVGYRRTFRKIPNKICYWNERDTILCESYLSLSEYTANVKVASGGANSTDLTEQIYLPTEWLSFVQDYVIKNLMLEKQQKQDVSNDGVDAI